MSDSGAIIDVVGIGADGWDGLSPSARTAVETAEEVIGSRRQLAMLPKSKAIQREWPSPIAPLVEELVTKPKRGRCVLASGDPMLHGIGATLARAIGVDRLRVYPHVSAVSLICARLGWPLAEVELVSAVGRAPELVASRLQAGRRIVVYVSGPQGAANLAAILRERGAGPSRFVVAEQLGSTSEQIAELTATEWADRPADPLHLVAIECKFDPGATHLPAVPGLPDEAFDHDGQLTKRFVRAATLTSLAPAPGQLLWDVGAGSGSIAIEWLRAERSAVAIAIERDADRASRISRNALTLGVPHLEIVSGDAPQALSDLPTPDAVFIGGGSTVDGMIEKCWTALRPGGRIVVNAVTLESEREVTTARSRLGGDLVRLEISHAQPIGGFTGWRPQMPVTQWSAVKAI